MSESAAELGKICEDFTAAHIGLLSSEAPRLAHFLRYNAGKLEASSGTGTMRREFLAAAVSLTLAAGSVTVFALQKSDKDVKDGDKRPRLALRAQPTVGVSPARVVLTAELVGGANDFEEYYCAAVEWEWGDDTRSESTTDCEPYEEGKIEIKRRFVAEHVFARAGAYKVYIRLKRRNKPVAAATANVQIRPGAREFDH